MMKLSYKLIFPAAAALIACFIMVSTSPPRASAQSIPKVLSDQNLASNIYIPDFSYAGYGFGLKDIPKLKGKIFNVTDFGAIADDQQDDSQAILKALEAAHNHNGHSVVTFPPGRIIVTEILPIKRSNIVLRGAGRGPRGTDLHFPRPLRMVGDGGKLDELREYLIKYDKRERKPKINLDELFSEYSWTGGFIWIGQDGARPAPYLEKFDPIPNPEAVAQSGTRGGFKVTLDNVDDLKKDQWIDIRWYNRNGENGELIRTLYGDTDLEVGSHHWSFKQRALVSQKTKILSIKGNQIIIANPLMHDISDAVPADIESWSPLTHVGIEDMNITFPNAAQFGHHTEEGYNGIYFTGSADSWARNIRFNNADSGIISYSSANLTLQDIRSEGIRPAHYAVHLGNVHSVLVERLQIFNPVRHSLTFNTQSTRNVYKDAEVFSHPTLDQHAGANHQNLFDNVTLYIQAEKKDDKISYPIFDGSGAGYWQPGHGQFNTSWNLHVIVESGANIDDTVILEGLAEGPDARIIGISGNRDFKLDYRPKPYSAFINQEITAAPSLYEYQLNQRRHKGAAKK